MFLFQRDNWPPSRKTFCKSEEMKSSTEMESSHVYKAQVRMCFCSVINSVLYIRAPRGCTPIERTPSPMVEEKNYTRLKSQTDLFLFLAKTKRFGSGYS